MSETEAAATNPTTMSGRTMQHYTRIPDSTMYTCNICNKVRCGKQPSNLTSHLKTMHLNVYESEIKPEHIHDELKMKIKRLKLVQNCVEITTINKLPFSTLLKSGFQKTVEKKLKKLEAAGEGVNLHRKYLTPIKNHVHETAVKIREKIKNDVKDLFFSMSADVVTKNNRSILGIYVQYISNGELTVRCIGMKELNQRHTGKYLCKVIQNCIEYYGVQMNQVISTTTDNASNMKTMINAMNEELDSIEEELENESDRNNYVDKEHHNEQSNDCFDSYDKDDANQVIFDDEIAEIINQVCDEEEENEIDTLFAGETVGDSWIFSNHSIELNSSMAEEGFSSMIFVNGVHCAYDPTSG